MPMKPPTTEAPRSPHAYPLPKDDGNKDCAPSIRTAISRTPNRVKEALPCREFKNEEPLISEGGRLREGLVTETVEVALFGPRLGIDD